MARTPTVSYGDAYSIGQVAGRWEKPSSFVQALVDDGTLAVDDNGLITNEALHAFHRNHNDLLD